MRKKKFFFLCFLVLETIYAAPAEFLPNPKGRESEKNGKVMHEKNTLNPHSSRSSSDGNNNDDDDKVSHLMCIECAVGRKKWKTFFSFF